MYPFSVAVDTSPSPLLKCNSNFYSTELYISNSDGLWSVHFPYKVKISRSHHTQTWKHLFVQSHSKWLHVKVKEAP